MTKLLCVDIDGTVRLGVDELGRFVNKPEDVKIFPEALTMMRRWKADGGLICGVTNQGGVALGILTLDDVQANMEETMRQCDWLFDSISICRHHPDATDSTMRNCWCRKPHPGSIIAAVRDMIDMYNFEITRDDVLMVGDRPEDQGAANSAQVKFQWATHWRAQAKET